MDIHNNTRAGADQLIDDGLGEEFDEDEYEDVEEDPAFMDNVYWRDRIPDLDFDSASIVSRRLTRKKSKRTRKATPPLELAEMPPSAQQVICAVATTAAVSTTTVIHVHHYHEAPTPAPASTKPVELGDAWVAKEEAERHRLEAECAAKEQQTRLLEARLRDQEETERQRVKVLESTREHQMWLEGKLRDQERQIEDLKSRPVVVTAPALQPVAAAVNTTTVIQNHTRVMNVTYVQPPVTIVQPPAPIAVLPVSAAACGAITPLTIAATSINSRPSSNTPTQLTASPTAKLLMSPWSSPSTASLEYPNPAYRPSPPAAPPPAAARRATPDDRPSTVRSDATLLTLEDTVDEVLGEKRDEGKPVTTAVAQERASDVVGSDAWRARRVEEIMGGGHGGSTAAVGGTGGLLAAVGLGGKKKKGEAGDGEPTLASDLSAVGRVLTRFFRYFNLARAVATAAYSVYGAVEGLHNDVFNALSARPLMIALIVFALVDLLVAFIKAFPSLPFCFPSKRPSTTPSRDPYTRIYSIWALIADTQLLTDLAPLLINVILKIYSYRLSEVAADPLAADSILTVRLKSLNDLSHPEYHNLILLALFALAVCYTLLYHTARIARVLVVEKGAPALAALVGVKAVLLLWDMTTNGLLLYETLVFKGRNMFRDDAMARVVLAVVIPSPVVALCTNVILNLPLHFNFLRMQLRSLLPSPSSTNTVPFTRVLRAALRKTFHPLLIAASSYNIYILAALFLILANLNLLDPTAIDVGFPLPSLLPNGTVAPAGMNGTVVSVNGTAVEPACDRRGVLTAMVGVNVVANYVVGAVAGLGYWLFAVIGPALVGGARGARWFKRRLDGAQGRERS
ncbi:hypothetical protein HK101_000403 [Irineochytrium annulatum]|nr:hypothetical protein HK101_000403 [Irineochytrium annulatum]